MLKQAGARRAEKGADWLVAKAHRLSASSRLPLSATLTQVYQRLQRQCLSRNGYQKRVVQPPAVRRFWCDSGLGGLARWLRAAGYDALWHPRIDDDDLLRKSQATDRTILTTDSMLMERRVIRDCVIPALWLPPTLPIPQQLEMVIAEFDLGLREPRCMSCGDELRRVDKDTVRDRIPPRTLRWLDEYYLCDRCHQLFWRGTHWGRIEARLKAKARR